MKTELNILQTAFRLFLGKGFSDISTNEIIREAGATKGGFYYCFKSREDLVGKVIETYLRPYYLQPLEEMRQAWENKRADVSTKTLLWDAFFAPQRFRRFQENIGMDIAFRDFYFLLYEGMKKYEEFKPDIVTMDITMPKLDGIDAVSEILKINPAAKIVMVTAAGQKTNIVEALKRGAADFIQKPFESSAIVSVLEKVMGE